MECKNLFLQFNILILFVPNLLFKHFNIFLQGNKLIPPALNLLSERLNLCLLRSNRLILENDIIDSKYHQLTVFPIPTPRVILYEFLKTFQRFPIILLLIPGMRINDTHLEKNPVSRRGIFYNNLLIFAQRSLVVPLAEKIIRFFK